MTNSTEHILSTYYTPDTVLRAPYISPLLLTRQLCDRLYDLPFTGAESKVWDSGNFNKARELAGGRAGTQVCQSPFYYAGKQGALKVTVGHGCLAPEVAESEPQRGAGIRKGKPLSPGAPLRAVGKRGSSAQGISIYTNVHGKPRVGGRKDHRRLWFRK